jgi:AcrR family transcriptional regulator
MMRQIAPKGNKRERTRARLLEAAVQVIREKGFYGTTLEEVARRAGMTRGAIYGNFKDKDELFLAVVETRWRPIMPIRQGATLKEHLRIVGEAVVAAVPARRAQALGALSFQIYALTHEEMRARIAQLNAEIYRRGADRFRQHFPLEDLPVPPEQFMRVLHALSDGLLFLRFVQPELITDDVIIAAFEMLASRR